MNSHIPKTPSGQPNKLPQTGQPSSATPLERFKKSMVLDFDKWHDGIGYDLDAIRSASPTEREAIEQMLISHSPRDWRDIEALAELNTERARQAIKEAISDPNPDVRVAVTRYAPDLVTDRERTRSIVDGLQNAELFGGLSQVLDDVAEYHPQEVKEALITGLLKRKGDVAVLFAAMLFYIFGKADEPFDMAQRPFFLRFNTEDRAEREAVFRELCEKLGIKAEKYLQ
ncbi:MAG: HEAT repeat domain-containing protein [Candidatus Bathyarchaeota archaeon]|nr:HEAT repeat domain-containing protein [Candidatus Bathyarchaeota archaeon]